MTISEKILWHSAIYNDKWVQNVPSVNTNRSTWVELRRNASSKARDWLREVAGLADKQGLRGILEALEESADTLRNYRGSMCGAEVCCRLQIQIQVLTTTVQELTADDAEDHLTDIAEATSCPEIMEFARGQVVR